MSEIEGSFITGRPVGGTENSWCRAVHGGTGIAAVVLLLSKPLDLSLLQNSLHNLQNAHPILRSKLRRDPTSATFSLFTPPNPTLQIQSFDLQSTAQILLSGDPALTPLSLILERELNRNAWRDGDPTTPSEADVFFASTYALDGGRWAVALRLHTAVCDVATAVGLLRELLAATRRGTTAERDIGSESGEVSLGIEDLIPNGKAYKPLWARGVDMIGYSLNFLRLANLNFGDVESPRSSQVVRLKMNSDDTRRILDGCKSRGIKLCGALAAAGLLAARSSKRLPLHQWEKYSVVTLVDCRSILHPPLPAHRPGFYHSAIQNTHDLNGEERLWELATRTYKSFENAKNSNKHFSDMADLNFLMCKAIDNPGLTPSSSLRTCLVSVFEDPVIDKLNEMCRETGLEDYMGCASVHGVGPSIAIFDTIRDGELDCACVYPEPLHSREQMQQLVDDMKRVLRDGCVPLC
ncbi:uncharacterized protein LOC131161892 [Malania oleifera]|uniref:uncharacterized protein LOC131161892 n=1 Tax=Malania oleifera TaxID=397392 RepID=UPI0025AEACD4|nr:uncharacterized protein LOC131161892 [Malania oleifera]